MRLAILLLSAVVLYAQNTGDAKQRIREARDLGKAGSETIPRLAPLLSDPEPEVRLEAVKSLVAIGTQHSITPLIQATRDNSADVQIRAVDGIVNFYLPGYVETGLSRMGTAIRSQFDKENTQVVDPSVSVREDAVVAIGRVASGGVSMLSRANAARAAGVLRGRAAVPDLVEALRSKNTDLIYESVIALQKIGDPAAGPRVAFLLRDMVERVQIAAVETTGLLKNQEAVPDLQKVYANAKNDRVRRAALTALSMLPNESSRNLFLQGLNAKDEGVRAAAAEGFARLEKKADLPLVSRAFEDERKMPARLAAAFAIVSLGRVETEPLSALTYLVNSLNSKAYRGVSEPYLIELARNDAVRKALPGYLRQGTASEKMGLARVLAASGARESLPHLEALAKDPDNEVAQEGVRALRNLRVRLN